VCTVPLQRACAPPHDLFRSRDPVCIARGASRRRHLAHVSRRHGARSPPAHRSRRAPMPMRVRGTVTHSLSMQVIWTGGGFCGCAAGLFPSGGARPHLFPQKAYFLVTARCHPGETPGLCIRASGTSVTLPHPASRRRRLVCPEWVTSLPLRHRRPTCSSPLRPLCLCGPAVGPEGSSHSRRAQVGHCARYPRPPSLFAQIVPMLNPDGVTRGQYRTDAQGRNMNRHFLRGPPELRPPAIAAIEALCTQVCSARAARPASPAFHPVYSARSVKASPPLANDITSPVFDTCLLCHCPTLPAS